MYIYQVDTTGKSGQYQLYEVYKIHDEGPPQVNEVGKWTGETKTLDFTDVDKNIRRRDLKVKIKIQNVQRSEKRLVSLVKQYPGRVRQNR